MQINIGTHPCQFRNMHKTVLKNRLCNHRSTISDCHKCHHLRLEVCWESRIGLGHHVGTNYLPRLTSYPQPTIGSFELEASGAQSIGDNTYQFERRTNQFNSPTCNANSHGISTRFYAVSNNLVMCPMQTLGALHNDRVRSDTLYCRAHCNKTFGQVRHLGFSRGVN